MKRIILLVLAFSVLLFAFPVCEISASNTSGLYKCMEYTVTNGKVTIDDCYTSVSGDWEIPSVINGFPVTRINGYAFKDCTGLTSLTIPDSIISIGNYAFEKCMGLTSVTILDSASIGDNAFYGCSNLNAVHITDISEWCDNWFYDEYSNPLNYAGNLYLNGELVTNLVIPDSVTSIKRYAFCNYDILTSVTIPDSVINIDDSAFEGCTGLTSITIPDAVTNIGDDAFRDCSSLTSVTIGDSVTNIGDSAFEGCTGLISITIPDTVTNIGRYAFYDCSLNAVYISDIAAWCNIYFSEHLSNPLFYAKNLYLNGELVTELVIPDDVTSIGNYAFHDCTSLTSITIPDSVASIGYYAFYGCSSLTSVTIPNSVTNIGSSAFGCCGAIESITVGSGNMIYHSSENCLIETESKTLIRGCKNSIIPSDGSVTSIGNAAFNHCSGLTSVTIPDSVTSIGLQAFDRCTGLISVTIPDSVTSIGDTVFRSCDSLTSITIPDSATSSIGHQAFSYCYNLTSAMIGNGVTSIDGSAFSGCSRLTSVTIGDSVTSIGDSAFRYCSSLTSVTIPDSVTSIGDDAFEDCSSLDAVYITDIAAWCKIPFGYYGNPLYYGADLYLNGELVTELVIPDDVTSIGNYAFSGCSSLISVNIPDGVTSIHVSVFLGCDSLTSITIPDSVTDIAVHAFGGCSSLTSITIPGSVTSIDDYAFSGCDNLTLCVEAGSYAHAYAIEQNIDYIIDGNIISVSVTSLPTKTVYPIYGKLNAGGLVITAIYDNGKALDITSQCSIYNCDMSTAGVKTVTVTYGEHTCSFEIIVDADLVEYPESEHDYASNTNETWSYTHKTPADSLKITFSSDTFVEKGYDFIYIYDGNGTLVGRYTGSGLAEKTIEVTGNSFSIKLVTDSSVTKYGFRITGIEAVYVVCTHTNTEIRNEIKATYTTDGYTGDTYCTDCGEMIENGEKMYALWDINKDSNINEADSDALDKGSAELDLLTYDFNNDGSISEFEKTVINVGIKFKRELSVIVDINGDKENNILDLVRLKKLAAGQSSENTSDFGSDFDSTGAPDSGDMSFVRKFVLLIAYRSNDIK